MQPGKKNDLSTRGVVIVASVVLALVGASLAFGDKPTAQQGADAGAPDAEATADMPPPLGCAAFAETNPNATESGRRGEADAFNSERPAPAQGRWLSEEPRTLVIRGIAACDRASILSAFPQSMPTALRSICTAYGFRRLRCEATTGAQRIIDLTEACPCESPTDRYSCRCDF